MNIVHLLSRPDSSRETASINCLKALGKWNYIQHVNELCDVLPDGVSLPENHHCYRPDFRPITWARHHGCFQAHKRAFTEFSGTFMMICEADCLLTVPAETFVEVVKNAKKFMRSKNVLCMSLCNSSDKREGGPYQIVPAIWGCHCIIFFGEAKKMMQEAFETVPWQPIDLWYNLVLKNHKIATTTETYAIQHGTSYMTPTHLSLL